MKNDFNLKPPNIMSAGDRNKLTGKPQDVVRHYLNNSNDEITICKRKNWYYASNNKDDVTCLRCLKLLNKN